MSSGYSLPTADPADLVSFGLCQHRRLNLWVRRWFLRFMKMHETSHSQMNIPMRKWQNSAKYVYIWTTDTSERDLEEDACKFIETTVKKITVTMFTDEVSIYLNVQKLNEKIDCGLQPKRFWAWIWYNNLWQMEGAGGWSQLVKSPLQR